MHEIAANWNRDDPGDVDYFPCASVESNLSQDMIGEVSLSNNNPLLLIQAKCPFHKNLTDLGISDASGVR